MKRLLPPLYRAHRGYFIMVTALLWVHLIACLDELLPHSDIRHGRAAWHIHDDIASSDVWGVSHALLVMAIVYGLYRPSRDMFTIRVICALSASVFTVLGLSFGIASLQSWPTASVLGIGFCGFIVISCAAMLQEPSSNPASEH